MKTLAELNSKIAAREWVNPDISLRDKMYLVLTRNHLIDGDLLRKNSDYASAICLRVFDFAYVQADSLGELSDWIMAGDYDQTPTIAEVAREYRELCQ